MTETCFNCDQPATTVDHVPPKVFFPEKKDLEAGQDLRKNLITAPACAACNQAASLEDERVAYMICIAHGNNQTAVDQVATKVLRALTRRPGFANKFLEDKRPAEIDGQRTWAIKADDDAFDRVMVRVARGLHFYRTGHRLVRDLIATSPVLLNDGIPNPQWATIRDLVRQLPWIEGPGCDNPEVFRYLYLEEEPVSLLEFYGGFQVLVNPKTEAS